MNLKKVAPLEDALGGGDGGQSCIGGTCPAIYETDEGDFVVQGSSLSKDLKSAIRVPEGEEIVLIPRELLVQLTRAGLK